MKADDLAEGRRLVAAMTARPWQWNYEPDDGWGSLHGPHFIRDEVVSGDSLANGDALAIVFLANHAEELLAAAERVKNLEIVVLSFLADCTDGDADLGPYDGPQSDTVERARALLSESATEETA